MDPTTKKKSTGKLKAALSLRNLKNNLGKKSQDNVPPTPQQQQQYDEETVSPHSKLGKDCSISVVSDGDLSPYTSSRNRTLNIFKSLKKKCKGTLSNCKPKQRTCKTDQCSESPQTNHVPLRIPSLPIITDSVAQSETDNVPPVPPRETTCDSHTACTNSVITHNNRGIQEELSSLVRFGWYWGSITRAKVEEKLKDQPDGAFLIRDSSSDNYILSLSFRSAGRTFHTRIEHSFGRYTFYSQQRGFMSIAELIETSMSLSESAVLCYSAQRGDDMFPGYPVRLTRPISRFTKVRSLQHLSRFVIRQYVGVNNIPSLPLPETLKAYLQLDYW